MRIGLIVLAYVIGSIPTGYWLGKAWKGIDVRQFGSGNLGATNVFRVLGKGPGIITLIIDILKGALPVFWAQKHAPGNLYIPLLMGLAAIIGHTTSLFVGFRGGKGVATSAGVFTTLIPVPSAIALSIFVLSLACTRIVSLSSILAATTLSIAAFALGAPAPYCKAALLITFFVLWTHRSNIKRLIQGTELRIGQKKTPPTPMAGAHE